MPTQVPTVSLPNYGPLPDESVPDSVEAYNTSLDNVATAAGKAKDLMDSIDEDREAKAAGELEADMNKVNDTYYEQVRSENAAIELRANEAEQKYIQQAAEAGEEVSPEAVSMARQVAMQKAASEEGLLTKAEATLNLSRIVTDHIRRRPRYAETYRKIATTVGGFGNGAMADDLEYLLDQREERKAAASKGQWDWLIQSGIKEGLLDPKLFMSNPAQAIDEYFGNWKKKQNYVMDGYALKAMEVGSQEAEMTINNMFSQQMTNYQNRLLGSVNEAVRVQTGFTNLTTLNQAIMSGTYPSRELDTLAVTLRSNYTQLVSQIYRELPPDARKHIDVTKIEAQLAPVRQMMEEAIKTLGTDKLGPFLDNITKITKSHWLMTVGPHTVYGLELVGGMNDSLLAKSINIDLQTKLAPSIRALIGEGPNSILREDGTVDVEKLNYGDPYARAQLEGLPPAEVDKMAVSLSESVNNADPADPDQNKHRGVRAASALMTLRYYANRASTKKKLPSEAVANGAIYSLVADPRIIEDFYEQEPEFRAMFVNQWEMYAAADLENQRQELFVDLKDYAKTSLSSSAPPVGVGYVNQELVDQVAENAGVPTSRLQDYVDLKTNPATGRTSFEVTGHREALTVEQRQAVYSYVGTLNRKYSNNISNLVKGWAHRNAIVNNEKPDYDYALGLVRDDLWLGMSGF